MGHDAIVVGGGLIGRSVAYHLAAGDAKVLLLERGRPGREASWFSLRSCKVDKTGYARPKELRACEDGLLRQGRSPYCDNCIPGQKRHRQCGQ